MKLFLSIIFLLSCSNSKTYDIVEIYDVLESSIRICNECYIIINAKEYELRSKIKYNANEATEMKIYHSEDPVSYTPVEMSNDSKLMLYLNYSVENKYSIRNEFLYLSGVKKSRLEKLNNEYYLERKNSNKVRLYKVK